jgi:hypothetical protein
MRRNTDSIDDINLEKEAPLLASIPKRNPYTVPEGYFDALPAAILEKCRENTAMPETKARIFWLFRPQWMVASLVLIIGFTFYTRNNSSNNTLEGLTAQVSDSAMYQSLQNNIDYVDVNSLEDEVQTDDITAVPLRSDTASNQQDIENYLMNHHIDASDIENEL